MYTGTHKYTDLYKRPRSLPSDFMDTEVKNKYKTEHKTQSIKRRPRNGSTPTIFLKTESITLQERQEKIKSFAVRRAITTTPSTKLKADILAVVCATNEQRKAKGLPELKLYDTISKEAQFHAEYMSKNDITTHVDPDGSIGTRLTNKNIRWMYVSENVASGFTTVQSVVEAWVKSPEHSVNILNPRVTHIRVGRSGNFWVQNFAQMIPGFKDDAYSVQC